MSKPTSTSTYRLYTYELWRDTEGGWTVNDVFRTPHTIKLQGQESDMSINRRLGMRGVTWDGDPEYVLYGEKKRNGSPAAELRREDVE